MKLSITTALVALAAISSTCVTAHPSPITLETRAPPPDTININVKNLYPEDCIFDKARNLFYQSNLWKGRVSVWNVATRSNYNLLIPGVSSSGDGDQQMAGLSINSAGDKLFAVAKNSAAFRFGSGQRPEGAESFHRFNLPASSSSSPVWSVSLSGVKSAFRSRTGTLPFGPVASAQDNADNSYVVFALGMPAIARVSPDGKTITPWYSEKSNGSQRPGYTGVAFIPEDNMLVAFGGPRPLTAFDLSSPNPTGIPVRLTGANFGSTDGSEKIHTVQIAGKSNLFAAKAPNTYRFQSSDRWRSATVRSATRDEFKTNSLTVVTEASFNGKTQVYGGGAYFGEGAKGGRTTFPLYRIYGLLN
ncbi:Six-bladed beta-propeller, TolB-like protein [Kalmanozyma brasiliensis GHG001]|uniref:Major allergen Mal f 1 n=1 Tax=Kalmanozyma brasiliensis (strain GHG001) TaxID=1365824 RepID=V5F1Q6_KALBG|nr:Six-bladed beta-propeller, TolB-like protein [Kalmanozyma brasiliensis GHG001]EST09254.1 Six-bladed beta-propeller, TolB-like protein [Kalmanozyma brasiliensis GHG001]